MVGVASPEQIKLPDTGGTASGLRATATAICRLPVTSPAVGSKPFHPVPGSDGCSCNACPYMRLNTLEKVWHCLATLEPAIELDEALRRRALVPIERMLAMSA